MGLFHTLADNDRPRFAASLAAAVRPGGRAAVLCWSDRNAFGVGPRRVTRRELRGAFRVADKLALLSDGKIVLHGTQKEFLASDNEKVRAFLERDFENRPIPA